MKKPNYQFEKRQKEQDKKNKKAEKATKKSDPLVESTEVQNSALPDNQ